MSQESTTTQQRILEAAKEEFMRLGFQKASLRSIVKAAGVTTGAFYGYYSDKQALFDALVKEPAEDLYQLYVSQHHEFHQMPPEVQRDEMVHPHPRIWGCFDYVYEHFDVFRLLICCAEGTAYENFSHRLAVVEVESTEDFLNCLRQQGDEVPPVPRDLNHMLASAYLSGFFETVVHNMPQEQAKEYVGQLTEFFTAGWQRIMGLS